MGVSEFFAIIVNVRGVLRVFGGQAGVGGRGDCFGWVERFAMRIDCDQWVVLGGVGEEIGGLGWCMGAVGVGEY